MPQSHFKKKLKAEKQERNKTASSKWEHRRSGEDSCGHADASLHHAEDAVLPIWATMMRFCMRIRLCLPYAFGLSHLWIFIFILLLAVLLVCWFALGLLTSGRLSSSVSVSLG